MAKVRISDILLESRKIIGEVDKSINLLKIFNIVEDSLTQGVLKLCDVFLTKTDSLEEVDISTFPKKVLGISSIYNQKGEEIRWSYHLEGSSKNTILVPRYPESEILISYRFATEEKESEELYSDLPEDLVNLVVAGIVSEYFLLKGNWNLACDWGKKYCKEICNLRKTENLIVKGY